MKLRKWQHDCVEKALNLYKTQNHFMCLATPGAGKTIMAVELAATLIQLGAVDFVLCFSPSTEVNESIKRTFSTRLNRRFDGLMGAIGGVYTYQSMTSIPKGFWQLLKNHKVLVIMDEVHHLKGNELANANAWGEEVLINIQNQASFTLALSGTPWRSDAAPIVLSKFTEPDNTIHCDFIYGLKEAIADGVCREPNIVLIDNEQISLSNDDETKVFSSLSELLVDSKFSFQELIANQQVINYVLRQSVEKLAELRRTNPTAGGLVVASSIKHAKQIYKTLVTDLHQTASIVTSHLKQPSSIINTFRHNQTQWIVSVGMISEGTDVPRLQVCCHLSHIKTEMHYRQVLGRILRVTSNEIQQAWLFTLAEANLTEFAYRIDQDLPYKSVIFQKSETQELDLKIPHLADKVKDNQDMTDLCIFNLSLSADAGITSQLSDIEEENLYNLALLGRYKEQIVRMFDVH
ncbi:MULTISPECIES: DEAD/DEAH box helicase [Pseudomonadati]|uniref:DEAD/DEAH box helicase family protein n=1 Tax=Shewanella aestuarii TaxID=1028752 RepID=A0ABT0L3L6_9GAMM|nr:DEAD/DEAH box helicase family protein [Shewanella aestuarii]MCL1118314.1 DEAD/DEAH box helicase family protein [Shewanella aestuarii]GGN80468.1 diguanylate cyclase [Shewanella aestuarii]